MSYKGKSENSDPDEDSCFSIYQISWTKMKKGTFCKRKNVQTFLEFWLVHFYDFVANTA